MNRQLRNHMRRLEATDPLEHSYQTSTSRSQSLGFALAGCVHMLRYQKNMRVIVVATLAVVTIGLWLDIESTSWAAICFAIALVWITEFINGAIEAAVNLASLRYHALAKTAKDVAAGAVLLAAAAAAIVGFLILGPPLIETISASFTPSSGLSGN